MGSDEIAVGIGPWRRIEQVDLQPAAVRKPRPTVPSSVTLRWVGRIVVATVIICALVIWQGSQLMRASADARQCQHNLRSIWLAWRAYTIDYGVELAPSANWPAKLSRYLPQRTEVWTCPATEKPYVTAPGRRDVLVWEQAKKNRKPPHPGGTYVVTTDGRVTLRKRPPQVKSAVPFSVSSAGDEHAEKRRRK